VGLDWAAGAARQTTPWRDPDAWQALAGLAVVLPCWNTAGDLALCLDRLRAVSEDPLELIVVDQGSTDGTAAWCATQPDVRCLAWPENRGYAAACNAGAEAATRPLVAFLHPDALVPPAWDRWVLRPFVAGPEALAVTPLQGPAADPPLLATGAYQTLADFDAFARRWAQERAGRWLPLGAPAASALWVVRRAPFLAAGGFPVDYGLGSWEQHAWARAWQATGGAIWVLTDCLVHHFGAGTFRANGRDPAAERAAYPAPPEE